MTTLLKHSRSIILILAIQQTYGQEFLVKGERLRLNCSGQASTPTVILESGLGMKLEYWQKTQYGVATFARVCSYDRASPETQESSADVTGRLHELLAQAHVSPPYIVVGHSIGGMYARAFTNQYGSEVKGLVLVDSSHEEQVWRQSEIAEPGVPKSAHPAGFLASGQHWTWHVDIPLIVVQRGLPNPEHPRFTKAQHAALEALHDELQKDLAGRSKLGKLVTAEHSGHMIPLDQPEVVIDAIREVFNQVKTGALH